MKHLFTIAAAALLFAACQNNETAQKEPTTDHSQHSQQATSENPKGEEKKPLSPHSSAMAMIGDTHIHIDYSSPRLRNRTIYGGLVAFDEVWVSGAHKATWLETNKDLRIAGNVLPAGKYALFTIPGRDQWTVIFNRNWDQHGKDAYSADDDVFRFRVDSETLPESKEELTYTVEKLSDTSGRISLAWEKKKISFPFELID